MEAKELFERWLEGGVRQDLQVRDGGVYLTAAEVEVVHKHGRVDFSGNECKQCTGHAVMATEHNPGDQFAWWRLQGGAYIVRFNETLKEGAPPVLLVSTPQLLACGCSLAATIAAPGPLQSVLTVHERSVNVKQNARIALLRALA